MHPGWNRSFKYLRVWSRYWDHLAARKMSICSDSYSGCLVTNDGHLVHQEPVRIVNSRYLLTEFPSRIRKSPTKNLKKQ